MLHPMDFGLSFGGVGSGAAAAAAEYANDRPDRAERTDRSDRRCTRWNKPGWPTESPPSPTLAFNLSTSMRNAAWLRSTSFWSRFAGSGDTSSGDTLDIAATMPSTADFRDDRSIEGEDTALSLLKLVLTVPKLLSVLLVSARDVAAPLVFDDPKLPRLVGTTGGLGVMNARGEGAHLNAVTPRTRASSRRIRVAPADSPE